MRQSEELHVCALMFFFVAKVAALTWLIPARQFQRIKEGVVTKVVAGISFEKYAKSFFPCLMVQMVHVRLDRSVSL